MAGVIFELGLIFGALVYIGIQLTKIAETLEEALGRK